MEHRWNTVGRRRATVVGAVRASRAFESVILGGRPGGLSGVVRSASGARHRRSDACDPNWPTARRAVGASGARGGRESGRGEVPARAERAAVDLEAPPPARPLEEPFGGRPVGEPALRTPVGAEVLADQSWLTHADIIGRASRQDERRTDRLSR